MACVNLEHPDFKQLQNKYDASSGTMENAIKIWYDTKGVDDYDMQDSAFIQHLNNYFKTEGCNTNVYTSKADYEKAHKLWEIFKGEFGGGIFETKQFAKEVHDKLVKTFGAENVIMFEAAISGLGEEWGVNVAEPILVSNEFKTTTKETISPIEKSNVRYTREAALKNPRTLYIFTDNTDRTSGSNPNVGGWYAKKYGKGLSFGSVNNPTTAVLRGLENAYPISTMKWFYKNHGVTVKEARWTDGDIETFKQVINDELNQIQKAWESGNYDRMVIPSGDGFFNSQIADISKTRTPILYSFLQESWDKLSNDILSKRYKDGNKEETNGQDILRETLESQEEDKLAQSEKIVNQIIEDSRRRITFDSKTHTYVVDGKPADTSVTQFINGKMDIGAWGMPSSALGTTVDRIVRDYFAGNLKTSYPNLNKEDLESLVSDLEELREAFDKQFGKDQYKIVTEEFPIAANFTVIGKDGKPEVKTMAGTMDMLIYDNKGNFYIFDMKTVRNKNGIDSEKAAKFANQLGMYKAILEANYPELKGKFQTPHIIEFSLYYPAPSAVKYEVDEESQQLYADGTAINDHEDYEAPSLRSVFSLSKVDFKDQFKSLSKEDQDLAEEELGSEASPETEGEDNSANPIPTSIYNNPLLSASERAFLANNIMSLTSFIITQLQNTPDAAKHYLGKDYNTSLVGKSREEIVRTVGLETIFGFVKEKFYNPANKDYDDFDTLDKLTLAYEHFDELKKMGYAKLMTLEGLSIIKAKPGEVKIEDLEQSLAEQEENEDKSTEEKTKQEYGKLKNRTSARSSLSIEIKRAFERLAAVDAQGNPIKDPFGFEFDTFVDSGMAVNSILEWVQNATTMQEMEAILTDMSNTAPWLNAVLKAIKQEPFRSQFYQNFRKDFVKYSVITTETDSDDKQKTVVHIINTKGATQGILEEVKSSFMNGAMPNLISVIKGDPEGRGKVNVTKVTQIKNTRDELVKELTRASQMGSTTFKKVLGNFIPEITQLLNDIGIIIDSNTLRAAFGKDGGMKNLNNTKVMKVLSNVGYLTDTLLNNKTNVTYNPILKDEEGNVYGNYQNIVREFSKYVQDSIEASTYENGKMYYSFVTPSYMGKLITNLSDAIKSESKFTTFMENEFGAFRWFKDGNTWNNEWLRLISNSTAMREALAHKIQLSYDKKDYTDLSELSYTLSLMHEYFYDKGKNLAWYRVPILSNKPSSEFIRFKRYSGNGYQDQIKEGLKKVFNQEIMRMKTVLQRAANPVISKIDNYDIKEKALGKYPSLSEKIKSGARLTLDDLVEKGQWVLSGSGAEFKFLPALMFNLTAKDELGQLIIDKLNGVPVDEYTLDKLFNNSVSGYMQEVVDREFRQWEEIGLFEEKETKKKVKGQTVTEKTFKYAQQFGSTREEIYNNLVEYIWNDMFATINIIQLTATDLAYYKNVEDFQKRYAQLHSPSLRLNTEARDNNGVLYSDGYQRTIYLADEEIQSDIMDNVAQVFNTKIATTTNTAERDHLRMMKDLIVSAFAKVDVANAQGYSSPTAYRKKLGMMGKWDENMQIAYDRIKSGNYNVNDLGVVWQPLKPFVYSQISKSSGADAMSEIKVPVQNKNSEYLLLIADALIRGGNKTSKLTAIFDFMEESAFDGGTYNGKGIDTVQFESAVKSGKMGAININGLNTVKDIKDTLNAAAYYRTDQLEDPVNNFDRYDDQFVHTIPFEDFGIQQEVPSHFADHEQLMGSQMRILSISDITPGTTFQVHGEKKPWNDRELTSTYQNLISDNIRDSFNDLIKAFNLRGSRKSKNQAVSKLLTEAILKDQRYGADLYRACQLDENGEFTIPLNDPIQSTRIQQLINSIIKSRINKQEIKGGPVVQASVFGMSDDLNIIWQDSKGNTLKTKAEFEEAPVAGYESYAEYLRKNQHSVKYFEAYMPIPNEEMERALTLPDGSLMDLDKAIAEGIIHPEMRKAIGYRIPTEDKYSMAPLYIKGFLPKAAGEAVMLPKEITTISGCDFDIDKMYIELKSFLQIDKNAKEKEFVPNILDARHKRNNKVFDIQWAVLTNQDTMSKMFNPGSFDEQKRTARIITILKGNSPYSYSQLSKMSLDELGKLADTASDKNIIFSTSQVYFHKQNMTAAKLIGVFANNNTSHAFISLQDISLNMDKDTEFVFDGIDVNNTSHNKLDALWGHNGQLISKTIAGFLAASVDAVKDPVLNFMNLNTFTANPSMVLARLGFDTDSIGLLLTQPIIEKVAREYFKRNNEGYTSAEEIIDAEIKNLGGLDKISANQAFTKDDLSAGITQGLNNTDFQRDTLLLFKRLVAIGKDLNTLTFLTKFNSVTNAVGPTIADTLVMRERYNKFLKLMEERPPFSDSAAKVIENSPILNAFYDTTVSSRGASELIFRDYFPHYSTTFSEVLRILGDTTKGNLDSKTINMLVNDFVLYKLTFGDNPVLDASQEERDRFINNFVTEFKEEAQGIVDNELIKIITTKSRDHKTPVATLEAKTGGYSADIQERIKNAWSTLITNPDTRDLGVKLFIYNLYRSGFSFSPKTFMHLASVDVKLAIAGYIDTIRDPGFNDYNVSIGEFLHQFRRNHSNSSKLVPTLNDSKELKVRKNFETKALTIDYGKKKELVNPIVVRDKKDEGIVFAPMINFDGRLYELVSDVTGSVTYRETTPLGHPFNFLEYDANTSASGMQSVLINKPVTTEKEDSAEEYEEPAERTGKLTAEEMKWALSEVFTDTEGAEVMMTDTAEEELDMYVQFMQRHTATTKDVDLKNKLNKILKKLC